MPVAPPIDPYFFLLALLGCAVVVAALGTLGALAAAVVRDVAARRVAGDPRPAAR